MKRGPLAAALLCGALGLTFGTRFDPRTVPMLFGIVVLPLTFLGAIYYSWSSLAPIRWLQVVVLVNPLVYMSEGFRMSPNATVWLTPGHSPQDASLVVQTAEGTQAFTHLWWRSDRTPRTDPKCRGGPKCR